MPQSDFEPEQNAGLRMEEKMAEKENQFQGVVELSVINITEPTRPEPI